MISVERRPDDTATAPPDLETVRSDGETVPPDPDPDPEAVRSDGEPTRPAVEAGSGQSRPEVVTARDDVVTAMLGACLVAGALTDVWAHVNRGSTLEGFFTPWHGLLYAGFASTAGWTFWLAYRRRDRAPRWWRDGWPAGYAVGALGVLVFMAGGLGDMVWHETFGVEIALRAAFSPSHLVIVLGSMLLLTSPLRSWWAAGGGVGGFGGASGAGGGARAAAGVVSLALATTMSAPLLNHSIALLNITPTLPYDPTGPRGLQHFLTVGSVDAYLVTAALLTIPLLLVHRRRGTPGTGTALVGGLGLFLITAYGFPRPSTVAVLAAVVGAALTDVALARLDALRGPDAALRLPLAGAVFPAVVCAAHLLGLHLAGGVRWPVEIWLGTVVLVASLGALLGTLAARPARRLS
jgi:hypothetical protein